MLTRWSDFGWGDLDRHFFALHDLRQEMDRLFSDFERGYATDGARAGQTSAAPWPRFSVDDAGSQLVLRAEIPGLSEKDLSITLEQTSLTIRGQRRDEPEPGYGVHRRERGALTFARSFSLPCRVEGDKVRAELKNGVLELTLPKAPEDQPREISIRAS